MGEKNCIVQCIYWQNIAKDQPIYVSVRPWYSESHLWFFNMNTEGILPGPENHIEASWVFQLSTVEGFKVPHYPHLDKPP